MGIDPKTLKVGDKILAGSTLKLEIIKIADQIAYFHDNSMASFYGHGEVDPFWATCRKEGDVASGGVAGHPRFLALLDQLRSMHLAKSADYGTAEDVYANYRRTAKLGIPPSKGILIRMADKWSRIETWANGGTLKNEGVVDSLLDLASYALGAVVMIEEEAK